MASISALVRGLIQAPAPGSTVVTSRCASRWIGPATFFDVVLDRVSIKTADHDNGKVTVTFNDVIWAGSDFANDWYAYENVASGREYYPVRRVDGAREQRILTVELEGKGEFGGAVYLFTSPNGQRYEGRAGNLLADTPF